MIAAANVKLARYETIKGFRVLTEELTVEKTHAALLDGLYDETTLRSA